MISMIEAVAERVIKATDRVMTEDDGGVMDIISNGQKHLAFIHSINPVDIHHKLKVCLETIDIDATAEEWSDIKEYLAALLSGQLIVVKANYNHVMEILKKVTDSGYSYAEWDELVRSIDIDTNNLLMVRTHYF